MQPAAMHRGLELNLGSDWIMASQVGAAGLRSALAQPGFWRHSLAVALIESVRQAEVHLGSARSPGSTDHPGKLAGRPCMCTHMGLFGHCGLPIGPLPGTQRAATQLVKTLRGAAWGAGHACLQQPRCSKLAVHQRSLQLSIG